MATKYNYEITDIDRLEAFAPNAVINVKKVLRGQISKLIDCKVDLSAHGVKVLPKTEELPPEEMKVMLEGKKKRKHPETE